jgi:hypothetical protein
MLRNRSVLCSQYQPVLDVAAGILAGLFNDSPEMEVPSANQDSLHQNYSMVLAHDTVECSQGN